MMSNQPDSAKVRLDKWLWAARFYKTRAIAKQMIEGGKVHYEGQRSKSSKVVELGARLQIRQGWDEREVIVVGLSEQRRGAEEAQALYTETPESIEKREKAALMRKAMKGADLSPGHKPDKRSRRQLLGVKSMQRE
jgi:ribosome-associated heat shock protein Hsp15